MRGKTNLVRWLLCMLVMVMAAQTDVAGSVIYVDDDAAGANNGSSWENAYVYLQDALADAEGADKPNEIRVAQGVYTPDRGVGIRQGERKASFQVMNGVTIRGGYAGIGEPYLDARDIDRYKSILSGDLNADDGLRPPFSEWENSHHIVTADRANATAVLDGFTINGGNADLVYPHHYEHGGGMYNNNSSPTLTNCIFSGNSAGDGGGMYNVNSSPMLVDCVFSENISTGICAGMYNDSSNPTLLSCIFIGNTAKVYGGGMFNNDSSPTLTNCMFSGNSAIKGGGMYNWASSPMLSDCVFSENSTTGKGGGMYNERGDTVLLNCIFSENSALRNGGGMFNRYSSQTSLTNCIFTGNSAGYGGGMENDTTSSPRLFNCTFSDNLAENTGGGISNIQNARPLLVNCILWGNIPEDIQGSASVSYSNVEGGWPGEGNISITPDFAVPNTRDYHLKSQAGRWDSISESWVIDETSSLCIDAGDPNYPVGLERFPNGARVNMGAYGGTPEASLSPRQISALSGQASNPSPADGAVDVDRNITLSWIGEFDAVFHDVYFGTDRNAVADSDTSDTTGIYRGRQSSTIYTPHEDIEWGRTYYWRIDEVDSSGGTITGEVWTFTTTIPTKGRTCFTSETNVWANGALIPISKVALGQSIRGMNCLSKIQEVQEHKGTFTCYDVLLESGNCLSVAENHYFLAESGRWISLQNLKAGIKLKTSKGSIEIISVTKRPMPYTGKVYNLKVAGSDRYLVGKDAVIVRDY